LGEGLDGAKGLVPVEDSATAFLLASVVLGPERCELALELAHTRFEVSERAVSVLSDALCVGRDTPLVASLVQSSQHLSPHFLELPVPLLHLPLPRARLRASAVQMSAPRVAFAHKLRQRSPQSLRTHPTIPTTIPTTPTIPIPLPLLSLGAVGDDAPGLLDGGGGVLQLREHAAPLVLALREASRDVLQLRPQRLQRVRLRAQPLHLLLAAAQRLPQRLHLGAQLLQRTHLL
jgi:hypothetical protein